MIAFGKASLAASIQDPADFPTPYTLLNNLVGNLTNAGYQVHTTDTVIQETQYVGTTIRDEQSIIDQFVNQNTQLFVDEVPPSTNSTIPSYDPSTVPRKNVGENSIAQAAEKYQVAGDNVTILADDGGVKPNQDFYGVGRVVNATPLSVLTKAQLYNQLLDSGVISIQEYNQTLNLLISQGEVKPIKITSSTAPTYQIISEPDPAATALPSDWPSSTRWLNTTQLSLVPTSSAGGSGDTGSGGNTGLTGDGSTGIGENTVVDPVKDPGIGGGISGEVTPEGALGLAGLGLLGYGIYTSVQTAEAQSSQGDNIGAAQTVGDGVIAPLGGLGASLLVAQFIPGIDVGVDGFLILTGIGLLAQAGIENLVDWTAEEFKNGDVEDVVNSAENDLAQFGSAAASTATYEAQSLQNFYNDAKSDVSEVGSNVAKIAGSFTKAAAHGISSAINTIEKDLNTLIGNVGSFFSSGGDGNDYSDISPAGTPLGISLLAASSSSTSSAANASSVASSYGSYNNGGALSNSQVVGSSAAFDQADDGTGISLPSSGQGNGQSSSGYNGGYSAYGASGIGSGSSFYGSGAYGTYNSAGSSSVFGNYYGINATTYGLNSSYYALNSGTYGSPTNAVTNISQGGTQNSSGDISIFFQDNTNFTASGTMDVVIATGYDEALAAGTTNVMLIVSDLGGGNTFNAGTNANVTEIAVASTLGGSSGPANQFTFGSTLESHNTLNIIIGDSFGNEFTLGSSVTSGINMIWGGGGTSTYDLYGVVDILHTSGTASVGLIETLANEAQEFEPNSLYEGFDWTGPGDLPLGGDGTSAAPYQVVNGKSYTNGHAITDIIDPTSKDILENFSGTYTPFSGAATDAPQHFHIFAMEKNGFLYEASAPEYGDLTISVATLDVPGGWHGWIPVPSVGSIAQQITILNFVNGDLGITFSGNALETGSPGSQPPLPYLANSSDPGSVYNFTSGTTINTSGDSGQSGDDGSGSAGGGGIVDGGTQIVIGGAPTSSTTVQSAGVQNVFSNGSATNTLLQSGGQEIVSPGGTDSNSLILNGGSEIISSGGTAYGTDVQSGGYALITAGGAEIGAVVGSGGMLVVASGGVLSGGLVYSGGLVLLAPGAVDTGLTFASGGGLFSSGTVIVNENSDSFSSVIANGSQILSGQVEYILGSGTTDYDLLNGGTQVVYSGAIVYDASISAGTQRVYGGGTASDTQVGTGFNYSQSSATEDVASGGVAYMTDIGLYGVENINAGGYGISSIVYAGGIETVVSGGIESGGVVQSGGFLYVSSGGIVADTTVSHGASQVIYAGGVASQATVMSGGTVIVSGGTAYGTTIQNGGMIIVEAGAALVDATVDSGGAVLLLGGVASGTVFSGGDLFSSGVVVQGPGVGDVSYSSVASGINIGAQRTEYVLSGGIALDNVLSNSNPYASPDSEQLVFSGGEAISSVISNGNAVVYSGGLTSGSVVLGSETIAAGGVAIATDVQNGFFVVSSGGVASGTVIRGGQEFLFGEDYGTEIYGGNGQNVWSTGISFNPTVNSGGALYLLGGEVQNLTLLTGGEVNLGGGVLMGPLLIAQGAIASIYTQPAFGSLSIAGQVIDDGMLYYDERNCDFSGGLIVNGTLAVEAGAILDVNSLSGQGVILNSGNVVLTSPFYGTINMGGNEAGNLDGVGSVLEFDGTSPLPSVTNFGVGDSVILQSGSVFEPGAGVGIDLSYNTVSGVLSVEETSTSTGSVVSNMAIAVSGIPGVYLNSELFKYNFSGGNLNIKITTSQTLNAGPGNTTFNLDGIASVINGDGGSDVINYVPGDGVVIVNEQNPDGADTSILSISSGKYGAGLGAVYSDARGDIILVPESIPGDTIVLSQMLDSGEDGIGYGVSLVTLPFGVTYTSQQLIAMAETAIGDSVFPQTLYAGWSGNTIIASSCRGNILVDGGGGTNTIYAGQGISVIDEESRLPIEQSVLILDWSAQDLHVTSDSAGDVVLTDDGSDSVTITSMLLGTSYGVGSVVLDNGITFSAAQIDAAAGSLGVTLPTTFPSVITGLAATSSTTDAASILPFRGINIHDPNGEAGFPGGQYGLSERVTITPSNTENGTLYDPWERYDHGISLNDAITLTTGPAYLYYLSHLIFIPTAHEVSPGQTVATTFTITDQNSASTIVSTATTTVIVTAVNDTPTITGTEAGLATTDAAAVQPFVSVIVTDPDFGVTDSVTITLTDDNGLATDADGIFSGAGLTEVGVGTYKLATDTPANLTAELEALTFTPTAQQVAAGGTVVTNMEIAVTQDGLTTTDTTTSVIVTATAGAPDEVSIITGTASGQTTTDEASVVPFSGTSITNGIASAADTLTITVTNGDGVPTDADGVLAGAGLTEISAGVYTLAAATPASLTAALDALTFAPAAHQVAPGQTVATGFTLSVTQGGLTTTDTTTGVIATAVNDAPVIVGTQAGQITTDEATLSPLASVTISDPDIGTTDNATITLTGPNGLVTDADGTLSGNGLTKIGTGIYTLAAATPGNLTTELDALTFTSTAHQVAPGQTVATGITLAVSQNGATAVNTLASVIATAVNDAPTITGTKAGQATSDEASLKALAGVTISDPDTGVTDSATITLTGTNGLATDTDGTLSGTGLTKIGTGLYTLAAATPVSLTGELDALVFAPTAHQVAPGQTVTTGITLAVSQNGATTTNTLASVIATAVNDTPTITGTKAGQTVTDVTTLAPLSSVSITDPDAGVTETVTLLVTTGGVTATDANGSLSGAGLTQTAVGTYVLSGTPSLVTAELDTLIFTPTPHEVPGGQTVTTGIIIVDDQNGAYVGDGITTIIATAVNTAPVVTGLAATQTTTDEASTKPFAPISITGTGTDTATITLTGTSGLATDADGTLSGAGLTKIGTGTYTLAAATAANLTSELAALSFAPTAHQIAPGQTITTGITLVVSQNGATTIASTSVVATAVNDAPSITGAKAGQTITDQTVAKPFGGVTISDPDTGVTDTMAITLTGTNGLATDLDGILSGTGLTKTGTGLYTLAAASPASLTAELESLSFTPTARQVPYGQSVVTGFDLSVTQNGLTTANTTTSVIAIDEEAPTTISNGTLIALQSGLTLNTGGTIHAIAGGTFANTIDYNTGYGALTITEATPGTAESSIVAFGSGITESQISVRTDSAGDLILTVGSTANQIILTGMAKSSSSGVGDVTFADGTTWTAAELVELASLQSSTGELDYSLSATTGQKTITGTGIFVLPAGITGSQVAVQSNNISGNLTVTLLGANGQATANSITIDNYWYNGQPRATLLFANGTTLSVNNQAVETYIGTATQTTLVGSNYAPNLFDLGPGGDQITLGANYDGGNGQNTINFGTGDGIITVTGNQGLADVDLSGTLTLTDVTLSTDASNDILLTLADGTDKLVFSGAKYNDSFEGLTFANGTTLTEAEILNTAETGTTGNDTINAAAGAEVIDGRGGNDVVNGGGGYDNYIYRKGYGNLTINNAAAGGTKPDGELDFGAGITSQDLWFTRSGNNLDIDVLGSKNLVVVDNWFSTPGAQLAEIKAYNGLEIDSGLNQLIAAMAAYNTATPAFNPETATQMPTNTALEAALATAWHG